MMRVATNAFRRKIIKDRKGIVLIAALTLLTALVLLGTTAFILSSTDIKIGGNFSNNQQVLEIAMAGAERGREALRQANIASADPTSFNSELVTAAGANATFELYNSGSDDVPIVAATTVGSYSYTVYLSNDSVDAASPTADSNNKVIITSIATGPAKAKAIVQIVVSLPPPPAPPPPPSLPQALGAITLLGSSESFTGGNSNAKSLNGDDQCGSQSPLPVVAVESSGSLAGVQSAINSSKPGTYHSVVSGAGVTGSTNINAIASTITAGQISSVLSSTGVDLTSAASLNNMVSSIRSVADTVVAGNGDSGSVNMGDVNHLKTVVVDGDFAMHGSGAGMLVVKGTLTFDGNVNYTGVILVIGKGSMIRHGGGNGTLSGETWVANTAGSDGIVGNADDALGATTFDTSGGGSSNIQYCSSAVHNALTNLHSPPAPPSNAPLIVKAFNHVF
jgi:Tfp pilus assembly protein PilX